MTRSPYTCRRCGERLGEVRGDELRLAPATVAAFDVRRRAVRTRCPACGDVRTFTPRREVATVRTAPRPRSPAS